MTARTESGSVPEIEFGYGYRRRTGQDAFAAGADAAAEARSFIGTHALSLVLVYASADCDLQRLLDGVRHSVGEVPVLGATTAGEICNQLQEGGVLVVALASPHLRVRWAAAAGVSQDWRKAVDEVTAAAGIAPYFEPTLDPQRDLAARGASVLLLCLMPGATRHAASAAFEIVEALRSKSFGRYPIFGTCATDDWRMEANSVFAGSQVLGDALLLAVVETGLEFGVALSHGFRATAARVTVSAVEGNEVLALDGRIAADVYSQLLGSNRAAFHNKHLTLASGRALGSADASGRYSLNLPGYFTPRGGLRLTQPVAEGTVLTLMEADPMMAFATGAEVVQQAVARGGVSEPVLALLHYCALRARLLGETAVGDEIEGARGALGGAPVLGCCGFGAAGAGGDGQSRHNDAAVAALVIGRRLSPAALATQQQQRLQRAVLEQVRTLDQRVEEGTLGLNVTTKS
ncbi:MAG: FIST N-terminal domain-containing protein [Nevskia sp.]|nr:FIST N-terminal domain-containing protein [Nevskia sp.]